MLSRVRQDWLIARTGVIKEQFTDIFDRKTWTNVAADIPHDCRWILSQYTCQPFTEHLIHWSPCCPWSLAVLDLCILLLNWILGVDGNRSRLTSFDLCADAQREWGCDTQCEVRNLWNSTWVDEQQPALNINSSSWLLNRPWNYPYFWTFCSWICWLPGLTSWLNFFALSILILISDRTSREHPSWHLDHVMAAVRDIQHWILANIWSLSGDGLHMGLVYLECNDKMGVIRPSLFAIVQDLNWASINKRIVKNIVEILTQSCSLCLAKSDKTDLEIELVL